MILKVHFLDLHLDYFPENLGVISEDQGKRFHQGIKAMEKRYQGRGHANLIADCCWVLKRDDQDNIHRRKVLKAAFKVNEKSTIKTYSNLQ